jgi:opacity protein-like surface antigen
LEKALICALTAGFCLGGATAAVASDDLDGARWYGALDFGLHWPGTIDSTSTQNAPDGRPYDWRWGFKRDWAIGARLGYRVSRHFRVEGEFRFEPTDITFAHAPAADVGGFSAARPGEPWGLCQSPPAGGVCAPLTGPNKYFTADYVGMANLIYDLAPQRRFDPFVGFGAGIAHLQMHTTYWFSSSPGPQSLELAGTLTQPSEIALQGLGGLSYRVSSRVHLDLTYHYAFTPGQFMWNPLNTTVGLPAAEILRPGNFYGRFTDQSATLGVRYAF